MKKIFNVVLIAFILNSCQTVTENKTEKDTTTKEKTVVQPTSAEGKGRSKSLSIAKEKALLQAKTKLASLLAKSADTTETDNSKIVKFETELQNIIIEEENVFKTDNGEYEVFLRISSFP